MSTNQEDENYRRVVQRKIVSSGRQVDTVEYADEPGVFYYLSPVGATRRQKAEASFARGPLPDRVNGPYPLDDKRFQLCKEHDGV